LLSGKKRIDGPDGVLAPLLKQFLEAALDEEVKSHIESSKGMSYEGISQELYQIYAQARQKMDDLEEKWGRKYPPVIKSWRDNWERLTTFYKYPQAIRTIMYTTNPIESLNRSVRKITKTKGEFTSETALLKLVYLIIDQKAQKWSKKIHNWSEIASQLDIIFGERAEIKLSD